jgi:hypothetical protein
MSISFILVCDETKQTIHVAESSGDWFRGSDVSGDLVGLFCRAHDLKSLRVTNSVVDEPDLYDYDRWEASNAFDLYQKVTGQAVSVEWADSIKK